MPAHPTVDLSTTSLIKLALHAAKYPASPVMAQRALDRTSRQP